MKHINTFGYIVESIDSKSIDSIRKTSLDIQKIILKNFKYDDYQISFGYTGFYDGHYEYDLTNDIKEIDYTDLDKITVFTEMIFYKKSRIQNYLISISEDIKERREGLDIIEKMGSKFKLRNLTIKNDGSKLYHSVMVDYELKKSINDMDNLFRKINEE